MSINSLISINRTSISVLVDIFANQPSVNSKAYPTIGLLGVDTIHIDTRYQEIEISSNPSSGRL